MLVMANFLPNSVKSNPNFVNSDPNSAIFLPNSTAKNRMNLNNYTYLQLLQKTKELRC